MRYIRLITLSLLALLVAGFAISPATADTLAVEPAAKHLPDTLGTFRAKGAAVPYSEEPATTGLFGITSAATREYQSRSGEIVSVALAVTRSESSAYALLTNSGCSPPQKESNVALRSELGTKSCVFPARINFARGSIYVAVEFKQGNRVAPETLQSFASALAPTLDKGEDQVPVLVKHLPGWPNIDSDVVYAVHAETLKTLVRNQPVLEAVSFAGGAEAVAADYANQRLVIVEFNTASFATDNDQRIKSSLQDLGARGQTVPSAYRRVGNYAVFVFNAPSQEAANQLIDQVKYQQVVQWLGENPFAYERATREFTETTLGVFVSVVKASGLALVTCLGVGGLFGALLFRMRRAQQREREAYADSDAMLRLNIDDLTPERDSPRLLGRGH